MPQSYPISLLFGMPRSGTTWIGKIVDSHPRVLYKHEPDSWLKLKNIPLYAEFDSLSSYQRLIQDYVAGLAQVNLPQVTSKLPLFTKDFSSWPRFLTYKVSVMLSLALSRVHGKFKLDTLNPISSNRGSKVHLAWKSIESLGRIGVFAGAIDGSKAIHIIRHPCGYIASVLKGEEGKRFVSSVAASEDYGILEQLLNTHVAEKYQLEIEQLHLMRPEQRLAWRWLLTNEHAMSSLANCDFMTLCYDQFCEDPLLRSKELFEFMELPWSEQTEHFIAKSTSTENDAYYSVYKNPRDSANKWRTYLDNDQVKLIQEITLKSEPLATIYAESFQN